MTDVIKQIGEVKRRVSDDIEHSDFDRKDTRSIDYEFGALELRVCDLSTIEAALSVLQRIASGEDWFPICDAPKACQDVALNSDAYACPLFAWKDNSGAWRKMEGGYLRTLGNEPTHWRPLDPAKHLAMLMEKEVGDGL